MMKRSMILMALLALAACGEKKTQQTITTADGSQVKVEQTGDGDNTKITATSDEGTSTMTAGGGAWPAGSADYATAYPGATVAGSFSGSSKDGAGGMVTFTTGDAPDKIIAFYKTRAAAAGLGSVSNFDVNGAKMFSATDEASGRSLAVQTSIADGKTTAVLTFGTNKK